MTRLELLRILVGKAHENGFDFKRWYVACLRLPWENSHAALEVVEAQRRYYALLFHHEFAQAFWKDGETISIAVPGQTFERLMPDGSTKLVERRAYVKRKSRTGVWRYHLQQMALQEEPLRYIRRFLNIDDDMDAPILENLRIEPQVAAPGLSLAASARNKTLELARLRAEKRKKMEEQARALEEQKLAALQPIPASTSRRSPRLPGAR